MSRLNTFLNIGLRPGFSYFESRRLRIVNLITLYVVALHILFTISFLIEKNYFMAAFQSIFIFSTSITLFINFKEKFTLAKAWLYITVSADIFVNALFTGKHAFTQYFYFGVFLLAFVIFTNRKHHYLFSVITLSLFLILQFSFDKVQPLLYESPFYYYFDIFVLFFILASGMNFFVSENEAQQQLILDKNTELQNKTKILEQTDLIRTKLFSIISHDLRSPIQSFKSLLELFEEHEISREEFEKYISRLKSQTTQLSHTLDQLLQWSYVQLKGVQTNPARFNITEIGQEEYNLLEQIIQQKSIHFTYYSFAENCMVNVDKDQIRIVIRNLIQNAIKYTPTGGSIHLAIEERDDKHIRVSVKDNGVGMEASKINEILYSDQVESSRGTNNEQGMGLGIGFCKHFLKQNHSSLNIESQKGQGSTFSFTLKKDL